MQRAAAGRADQREVDTRLDEARARAYEAAYQKRDAKAVAAFFTADAELEIATTIRLEQYRQSPWGGTHILSTTITWVIGLFCGVHFGWR